MKAMEYVIVKNFYEGKVAERSGLPYINHIDEGLRVLDKIGADDMTKRAWCLHPFVQADSDLVLNIGSLTACKPTAVALAVEYRHVANSYLSTMPPQFPKLSPLKEVNDMLIADKVQNYKDLVAHNTAHPHYERLLGYFHDWFAALDLSGEKIDELCAVCEIKS